MVAKKPAGLSHVNAAALALTGLTAINAVDDTLKLKRGETILIQGGAGGVASFAIQFAKHIGAKVISTASAANVDYVRSLGADQVIDYSKEDFTRIGPVCDAVFETVGGEVAAKSYEVLKPGGRAAFIASGPKAPPIAALRRAGAAPAGAAHAGRDGADRAACGVRRGEAAGGEALQAQRCRRERIASARAGISGASWCFR